MPRAPWRLKSGDPHKYDARLSDIANLVRLEDHGVSARIAMVTPSLPDRMLVPASVFPGRLAQGRR
eukprot:185343-Pyramimonas_sp.AAC.1